MSLTSALTTAQSALSNTSRHTSVVSRNIADAQNPDYARRAAVTVSTAPGARTVQITRAADEPLFRANLSALSGYTAQSTLMTGMDRLSLSVNGDKNGSSPALILGRFQEALQLYSASPSNRNLAQSAVEAAHDIARSLNQGSAAIQTFRTDMDRQIATSVAEVNTILSDFQKVNAEIVNGTRTGADINDALDQRDGLLKRLAEYLPISTIKRGDNDMVIMTQDGATLFETLPREVTFDTTLAYSAGVNGSAIRVDGVPVRAGSGGNTSASGTLAAMVQLRDDVSVTMQAQLDEIARGLIQTFAEHDPSGTDPSLAGLFTWAGGPGLPAGTLSNGLAASIRVNAAFDSTQGGDPQRVRDGGANGAAYVTNVTGAASFSDRIIGFLDGLEQPISFDAAAGIPDTMSVTSYATAAIGWFEAGRQAASNAAETKNAVMMRTSTALSNMTGVNIDEEMTLLLELEHTYAASAKLLQTVNDMLASLIAAVR
jgi:flagellar hook-associated protein 1 FlgK